MQMDSRQIRILKASCLELEQLFFEAEQAGYLSLCDSIEPVLEERYKRLENGRFHSRPGDSGTPPHTN